LDLGCGYFGPYVALDWSRIEYRGIDVVPEVVEHNRRAFETDSRRFQPADLSDAAARPQGGFDIVLVKDVLQHWSFARIMPFLRYLTAFPRVPITNSTNAIRANWDVPDGDYRGLDVRLPPFCIPDREIITYEVTQNPMFDPKTVLYWEPPSQRWTPSLISLKILGVE
jgi:SAM-dependent methyltransferase